MKQDSIFLIALVVAALAAPAYGQIPDAPNLGGGHGGNTLTIPGGVVAQQMVITNKEFKEFQPAYQYETSMDLYPAVMTIHDARNYAKWAGKEMDKDLVWRPLPRSEKGILYIVAAGIEIEASTEVPVEPTAPEGMVHVPEGAFTMGSDVGDPDEMPKRQANTGAFFIDKFEVTNAQFQEQFPQFEFPAGREKFPAVVTWEQADAYAQKVGKRLPTEAEWEKAARGTDGRMFPWGDSWDWSFVIWDEKTLPGGAPAKPPSPYGCIDMAGGVWEWTADWYQPYEGNETPSDAYGEQFKVLRGGSTFNDIAMFRCSHRFYLPPNTTGHYRVGFRCAQDVKRPAQ